jgi:DNA-binding transcriptional regulator GbsR (MarR family)
VLCVAVLKRHASIDIIQYVLNDQKMTRETDNHRTRFVNQMGQAAEIDGMSPIAGRLFATLLLSPEPRSLDELAAEIGVSKASVSTDARRLLERGIVERVTHAGDRRDYYELAPDFFAKSIRNRVAQWRRIHGLVGTMREVGSGLPSVVRERIASIDDVHAFVIDRVDAALDEWERESRKRAAKPSPRRRSA